MWSEKCFPNPSVSPLSGFRRRRFSATSVTVIRILSPFPRLRGSSSLRHGAIDPRTAPIYIANPSIPEDPPVR
jgi:hypothetical protein